MLTYPAGLGVQMMACSSTIILYEYGHQGSGESVLIQSVYRNLACWPFLVLLVLLGTYIFISSTVAIAICSRWRKSSRATGNILRKFPASVVGRRIVGRGPGWLYASNVCNLHNITTHEVGKTQHCTAVESVKVWVIFYCNYGKIHRPCRCTIVIHSVEAVCTHLKK